MDLTTDRQLNCPQISYRNVQNLSLTEIQEISPILGSSSVENLIFEDHFMKAEHSLDVLQSVMRNFSFAFQNPSVCTCTSVINFLHLSVMSKRLCELPSIKFYPPIAPIAWDNFKFDACGTKGIAALALQEIVSVFELPVWLLSLATVLIFSVV